MLAARARQAKRRGTNILCSRDVMQPKMIINNSMQAHCKLLKTVYMALNVNLRDHDYPISAYLRSSFNSFELCSCLNLSLSKGIPFSKVTHTPEISKHVFCCYQRLQHII